MLITAIAGFGVSPIPTPERVQIPSNFLNDEVVSFASQRSAQSLTSDKGALNPHEILVSNTIRKECVLPMGFTRKQKKQFDECVAKLGDCEKGFDRNSDGDYYNVECKEN